MNILTRIDSRLRLIQENANDLSWKDEATMRDLAKRGEFSDGYHALRAIAGPATPSPIWAADWTAPTGHTYKKGTPAPHWTEDEIYWAMLPQLRTWARGAIRRSVGGMHGSRVDPNAVDDAEMNIASEMVKILRQEVDEGRILSGGGFVSYVARRLKEAALTGVGGTEGIRNAIGRVNDLKDAKTPEEAIRIANMVKGPYRTQATAKVDDDNPFDRFSPSIHAIANNLAQALATGDETIITPVRQQLDELETQVRDASTLVQGVDTGRRIISTPHGAKADSAAKADLERFYKTKISSLDAPAGPESDVPLGATIAGDEGIDLRGMDKEIIFNALKLGRGSAGYANPKVMRYYAQKGLKPIEDSDFRYLIRLLAPWLPKGEYPGKGDATGEKSGAPGKPGPYRDPEIDPKTGDTSDWVKRGMRLKDVGWSADRLDIVNDIINGGPQKYGAAGTADINTITGGIRLTPTEVEVLEMMLGLHASSPQPLSQAQISRSRGISKVRVNKIVKDIVSKTGMTIVDMLQQAQQSKGAAPAAPTTNLQVSQDPIGIFKAWMQEYMGPEDEMDESRYIEVAMIAECLKALQRLDYYITVYPIITGNRRRMVLLHEERVIRR